MLAKLGVLLMDEDHAALERMFGDVDTTPDADLPQLFEAVAAELAAHFAREEKAMTQARVPILLAHIELHQQILIEVARMRRAIAAESPEAARQLLGAFLPALIEQHVATADTATAHFLRG